MLEKLQAGEIPLLQLVVLGQVDGLGLPLDGLSKIAVFRVGRGKRGEVPLALLPLVN